MRKVILFIAMGLGGCIAAGKGGVVWLGGQGNHEEMKDAYWEFVEEADTAVMG